MPSNINKQQAVNLIGVFARRKHFAFGGAVVPLYARSRDAGNELEQHQDAVHLHVEQTFSKKIKNLLTNKCSVDIIKANT